MAMDRERQRQKLIEGNRGITAFTKLLGQIGILDERIREHVRLAYSSPDHRRLSEMVLDTETFYTVAADSLRLASLFFDAGRRRRFESDPGYKTILRIRSECVRHAFDKPDGDTYGGFGFGPDFGPVLKAGSGRKEGKGYFHDRDQYWRLLQDHDVVARGSILMPSSLSKPVITESMTRRFTGRSEASTNEGATLSDDAD